ncbi:hypothetical protein ACIPJG_31980 [Streptomyces halstedii]|uniref:hypothetical protein n=1 Tax=Streptomyces halstedii TaxID=1944 RepID=UPI0038191435
MAKYIQAWEIKSPEFSGYVYDQAIALSKWSLCIEKSTMESVTIVRHEDGSREYLNGTIASEVQAYRERE